MSWDNWFKGEDCSFCAPLPDEHELWDKVVQLEISTFVLAKNQAYLGTSVLIFDPRHVTRPGEMSSEEWGVFMQDVYRAEKALYDILQPDHMNLAMLGWGVPHIHCGIFPRYRDDGRWGQSIWTTTKEEMVHIDLEEARRTKLMNDIRERLS